MQRHAPAGPYNSSHRIGDGVEWHMQFRSEEFFGTIFRARTPACRKKDGVRKFFCDLSGQFFHFINNIRAGAKAVDGTESKLIRKVDVLFQLLALFRHQFIQLILPFQGTCVNADNTSKHDILEMIWKKPLNRQEGMNSKSAKLFRHQNGSVCMGEYFYSRPTDDRRKIRKNIVRTSEVVPDFSVMTANSKTKQNSAARENEDHPVAGVKYFPDIIDNNRETQNESDEPYESLD
jgi:hypothetical protein